MECCDGNIDGDIRKEDGCAIEDSRSLQNSRFVIAAKVQRPVVSKAVCERQGSKFSNPGVGFYDKNPVKNLTSNELDIRSDSSPGWNDNLTDPLRLNGSVTHTLERIIISLEGGEEQYLDNLTFLVSDGMTVDFAGGIQTSLDTGILSLASKRTDVANIPTSFRGASVETYTPLTFLDAHGGGDVPISASWGLHVGSARHNIPEGCLASSWVYGYIFGRPTDSNVECRPRSIRPQGIRGVKCQATGVPLPFWASEMSTEARKERKLIKTLEKSISAEVREQSKVH